MFFRVLMLFLKDGNFEGFSQDSTAVPSFTV